MGEKRLLTLGDGTVAGQKLYPQTPPTGIGTDAAYTKKPFKADFSPAAISE